MTCHIKLTLAPAMSLSLKTMTSIEGTELEADRGCLCMEGLQTGFQGFWVVILAAYKWLASDIVLAGDFWRRKFLMVGAAAFRVYEPARYPLYLQASIHRSVHPA